MAKLKVYFESVGQQHAPATPLGQGASLLAAAAAFRLRNTARVRQLIMAKCNEDAIMESAHAVHQLARSFDWQPPAANQLRPPFALRPAASAQSQQVSQATAASP